MKKKLILISLLGGILSVIIYFFTQNNEIIITTIGDGLTSGMTSYGIEGFSFNDYLKEDYINKHELNYYIEYANANQTVKELIYDIKENKKVKMLQKEIELKQAISKADILTIAIGMDELANIKINRAIKEEFLHDMDELLSMIKMLNQNKVIVVGLYTWGKNDFLTIEKLNASLRDIALTNGFEFIDINKIMMDKNYYLTTDSYYINYLGHKRIYEEMKKVL